MNAIEKTIKMMVASGEYDENGARASFQRKVDELKSCGITWDEAIEGAIEFMEETLELQPITATRREGNWVTGTIHGIRYTAKVFEEGSQFGINGGNISSLWIDGVLNYDRGWDKRPTTDEGKAMLKEMKAFFKDWKVK